MNPKNDVKKLAFTCPVCGRTTDRPQGELQEGSVIVCPFCQLRLTLHGHMWQEVKERLEKL
jgi:DNA-directed RNA polymerase subunit RPC12/RpoP